MYVAYLFCFEFVFLNRVYVNLVEKDAALRTVLFFSLLMFTICCKLSRADV